MMWGPYWQAGMGWWWMIIPALFWIALLAAIIWGVARLTGGRGVSGGRDMTQAPPSLTAEEILKQRFARGEIDAQTYDTMRERLAGEQPREVSPPRV
jgi:putative membrane protein